MIIIHKKEIICHLSCSPSLENGVIKKEGKYITQIPLLENSISAYLFLTGWTDINFRRKGLSLFLRKQFFYNFKFSQSILLGISTRKAALPLLQKLGGIPLKPTKYPFVYALSSINTFSPFFSEKYQREKASFWVSNIFLAENLNMQISNAVNMTAFQWAKFLNIDPHWHQWEY